MMTEYHSKRVPAKVSRVSKTFCRLDSRIFQQKIQPINFEGSAEM